MNEQSSATEKESIGRTLVSFLLVPFSFFPLIALLTYDWRSTPLCVPQRLSSNLLGAFGNNFAYYGYMFFGLAIWAVPVLCILGAIRILVAKHRPSYRDLWFMLFLLSASCLAQVAQNHAPGIASLLEKINVSDAGGALGHLIMTRAIAPLLGDFGASVTVIIIMVFSLVASVGFVSIYRFFYAIAKWVIGSKKISANASPAERAEFEKMIAVREEAKRLREEEKARARAEKEEAKRAREEEKQKRADEIAQARARLFTSSNKVEAAPPTEKEIPSPIKSSLAKPTQNKEIGSETNSAAQPTTDKEPYVLPPIDLLNPLSHDTADHADVEMMTQKLLDTLKLFNIDATLSYTVKGPVVTKYALLLAPGTRYSSVTTIANNIKGALHAKSLRIEAPIPGEECIGIEVPNLKPVGITFREVFESDAWKNAKMELPLLFGKDAAGKELIADLATMPHLLVAGATGQGKSVCLNSLINGLLMTRTPDQLKLIMVDPKSVEFTPFSNIPHLLVPVITDNRKVVFSLHWAVAEMEKRLKMFARARVKNIYDYNRRKILIQPDMFGNDTTINGDLPPTVPYIIIIIDEVADLMAAASKEVTPDISRLTAKARAAGIHLILATQRPDAKIITGTIKANIPGRVAFKTAVAIDSRTILDDGGAENLIGRGDMLFKGKDGLLTRAQGAWISDEEISRITSFIEEHAKTQFDEKFATKLGRVKEDAISDPFADNEDDPDNKPVAQEVSQRAQVKAAANADDFKKAIECLINTNRASTSHFQRQMGWGYNHAAKILDMLTEKGIVSPQQGMGPRQIIMDQDQLIAILNGGDIEESSPKNEEENTDLEFENSESEVIDESEEV